LQKQKRILTAIAVLLSLFVICLFLALSTEPYRRERRELNYVGIARQSAEAFDVPLALVLAVIRVESDFHPNAVSSAGACGLMQLMPDTFLFLQEELSGPSTQKESIFDPSVNIRYGTYYLSYLYKRFKSWQVALAAYNAGEGRVQDWLDDNGRLVHIPFPETARYLESTLSAYEAYRVKYQ
jgi:soluble lytic murein transglycosylase